MPPTDHEAKKHEAFIGLCESIFKLGRWRPYLTKPQCIALAETCRDLADALDAGEGERSKRYRIPTRKKLINVGLDAQGRRLFRLNHE
jgi:hypothetical protein